MEDKLVLHRLLFYPRNVQPVVAAIIQQQSADGFVAPNAFGLLTASVEQPVVASTIQQQSSGTAFFACTESVAEIAEVEHPVVARTIQQQSSVGLAVAASFVVAASDVEQPVVASTIQQQSFVLFTLMTDLFFYSPTLL